MFIPDIDVMQYEPVLILTKFRYKNRVFLHFADWSGRVICYYTSGDHNGDDD
jgi:hypothetical protein